MAWRTPQALVRAAKRAGLPVDWSKVTGNPNVFQLTNVSDGTPRPPINIDGVDVVQTQQAPVAQYLAGATFLQPECAALGVVRGQDPDM